MPSPLSSLDSRESDRLGDIQAHHERDAVELVEEGGVGQPR